MIRIVAGFFVLMVMISAGTVYSLKETTERLEARRQQLSAQILIDRSAIKVLRAEMAYLSQPKRLQKLSQRFLALSPTRPYQMASSVTAIAGRDGVQRASLPVDEFPVLLPQKKPRFEKKKFEGAIIRASFPVARKQPTQKTKDKKAGFYERISLKLETEK